MFLQLFFYFTHCSTFKSYLVNDFSDSLAIFHSVLNTSKDLHVSHFCTFLIISKVFCLNYFRQTFIFICWKFLNFKHSLCILPPCKSCLVQKLAMRSFQIRPDIVHLSWNPKHMGHTLFPRVCLHIFWIKWLPPIWIL